MALLLHKTALVNFPMATTVDLALAISVPQSSEKRSNAYEAHCTISYSLVTLQFFQQKCSVDRGLDTEA